MLVVRRLFLVSLACALAAGGTGFAQTLGEVQTSANVEYGRHGCEALLGDVWAPTAAETYPDIVAVLFSIEYRLVKPRKKMFPGSVYDEKAAVQFAGGR